MKINTRTEKVSAKHGGEECPGPVTEEISCNEQECPGKQKYTRDDVRNYTFDRSGRFLVDRVTDFVT